MHKTINKIVFIFTFVFFVNFLSVSQTKQNSLDLNIDMNNVVLLQNIISQSENKSWNANWDQAKKALIQLEKFIFNDSIEKLSYPLSDIIFIKDNFNSYKFQIIGVDFQGKKILYINSFYFDDSVANFTKNWQKEIIEHIYGGPKLWSIYYDIEKNVITNFSIDGYE